MTRRKNRLPDFPNFTKDLDNWLWEKHKAIYRLLQSRDLSLKIKLDIYTAMGSDFITDGKTGANLEKSTQ